MVERSLWVTSSLFYIVIVFIISDFSNKLTECPAAVRGGSPLDNITLNSFGTELSKDDREKLYPRCGKLYPEGETLHSFRCAWTGFDAKMSQESIFCVSFVRSFYSIQYFCTVLREMPQNRVFCASSNCFETPTVRWERVILAGLSSLARADDYDQVKAVCDYYADYTVSNFFPLWHSDHSFLCSKNAVFSVLPWNDWKFTLNE